MNTERGNKYLRNHEESEAGIYVGFFMGVFTIGLILIALGVIN